MPAGGKSGRWRGSRRNSRSGTRAGWRAASTLLVCRNDGIDWAVFFNSDADKQGKAFADLIDPLLHGPANEVKNWPEIDLFSRF